MKNISKKLIGLSILLLFIGVTSSSAISVNKAPMTIIKNKEDCGCNEVSDADIVRLEKQLSRIEIYDKLLLILNKFNPKLKELSTDLISDISTFLELIKESDFLLICFYLFELSFIIYLFGGIIYITGEAYIFPIMPSLGLIFMDIGDKLTDLGNGIIDFANTVFDCEFGSNK